MHSCLIRSRQIEKILQSLEDEALTKHDLPAHLEKLKKFAKECVTDAEDVQRQFASWQKKAEEIRLACTEEDCKKLSDGPESVGLTSKITLRSCLERRTKTRHRVERIEYAERISGEEY